MFGTWKVQLLVMGMCCFIGFLSFKPSEPYLSEFLICNYNTQQVYCGLLSAETCNAGCILVNGQECLPISCSNVSGNECGSTAYSYCKKQGNECINEYCYKSFSEDEVNNDIYPWSTYAYLPFLLVLGPFAEIFSYRIAILVGISGRVATRFLLLYGTTIFDMQVMQVVYSMGTAAEDVFSAYVYYVVPPALYQDATSYIKASALIAFVVSGILGDILVTQANTSLTVLMLISAAFVTSGAALGLFVIRPPKKMFLRTFGLAVVDSHDKGKTLHLATRLQIFRRQLQFLRYALRSHVFNALLAWWIFGNAAFTIVYGYEVSIYEELNGKNDWNGSVLSIMLLAGSAGALLPPYLQTGSQPLFSICWQLCLAGIIASVSLALSIIYWETIATTACLTIFFGAWQFINVIFYARLASALKTAQLSVHSPVPSSSPPSSVAAASASSSSASSVSAPLSLAVANTVGSNSTCTATGAGAGAGAGADSMGTNSAFAINIVGGTNFDGAAINVMPESSMHPPAQQQQQQQQQQETFSSPTSQSPRFQSTLSPLTSATVASAAPTVPLSQLSQQVMKKGLSVDLGASLDSADSLDSVAPSTPLISHIHRTHDDDDDDDDDACELEDEGKEGVRGRGCGGDTYETAAARRLSREDAEAEALQYLQDIYEDSDCYGDADAEPPYSVAVVAVVAASVVVQIVVQAIVFSWLQLELRVACAILVLLFCVATGLFVGFFCTIFFCHRYFLGARDTQRGRGSSSSSSLSSAIQGRDLDTPIIR